MSDIDYIPEAGTPLSGPGLELIIEAVNRRRTNFPDEPLEMTLALILLNIGSRFNKVICVELEWMTLKKDVPKGEGVPKCPNGHVLFEERGVTIGWVKDFE